MTTQVVRVTDEDTRADIAEALTNLCAHAKRQQYVVERSYLDLPTAWTKAHQQINAVLADYFKAKA